MIVANRTRPTLTGPRIVSDLPEELVGTTLRKKKQGKKDAGERRRRKTVALKHFVPLFFRSAADRTVQKLGRRYGSVDDIRKTGSGPAVDFLINYQSYFSPGTP
jgi:hypothetical protein